MKTKMLMLYITLLSTILFAQEELKIKDGRTIIINTDGTWKYKQSISKDSRDGKVYKTVKIGTQTWMTINLNVSRFRNGDPIPEAKTEEEWTESGKEGKPAWCYYDNNPENGKKYGKFYNWYAVNDGKLYNWYAVNDKRGLAPEGWHIPTKAEFETLESAVDNDGNKLKAIGQETDCGAGKNTSGFSALLSGVRDNYGYFGGVGGYTTFWSFTDYESNAYHFTLRTCRGNFDGGASLKGHGLSVRCVKD